jgi:hypothetical protein
LRIATFSASLLAFTFFFFGSSAFFYFLSDFFCCFVFFSKTFVEGTLATYGKKLSESESEEAFSSSLISFS